MAIRCFVKFRSVRDRMDRFSLESLNVANFSAPLTAASRRLRSELREPLALEIMPVPVSALRPLTSSSDLMIPVAPTGGSW